MSQNNIFPSYNRPVFIVNILEIEKLLKTTNITCDHISQN